MKTFKKLLFLLTANEKKSASLLLLMILIMALLDTIGVASILPFMAVLTNPSLIETNFVFSKMFEVSNFFGVENNDQFFFVLGVLVLLLLVISLAFKALTDYTLVRFVQLREYSIGKRLIESYLNQPYSWFLNHHSADLGKNILSEVGHVVGDGIRQMIELIAKGMVAIALISLLIITSPKLAIIVSGLLGGIYALIFYFIRLYIDQIGKKRLKSNQLRYKFVSEAFGASKEVKVGGLENIYIKNFSESAKIFALTKAYSSVLTQLPRFVLEAIAFGGVMMIVLYMMSQTGNFNNALPIISLYVFAGYRLMPALQQIYASLTQITFVGPALDKLYYDLKNLKSFNLVQDKNIISLNKSIRIKNLYYNYPNSSRTALKNINLNIPIKSTIGLVGATGSGKTTTVDIILGLLEAQKGSLEVDGKIITRKNSRSWQRSIGYVPQHIYLSDDTVAANIAFGVNSNNLDQKAILRASKIANLHDFVMDELPNQYNTTIGERGVRLSGGQRQRIGISRALYHNPKVLILDEATSSLDNHTEKAVMDAINNLDKEITIILIAHRLNTVKNCDKIFLLKKGQIIKEGTFEELINIDENFSINDNNQSDA